MSRNVYQRHKARQKRVDTNAISKPIYWAPLMHSMAVKNSRARSGFLIYSYFKDSVFTAVIFPFARLSLFSLGEYITYSLTVLFTGGKVGDGVYRNKGGVQG